MEPEFVTVRHVKRLLLVRIILINLVIIKSFYCLKSNETLFFRVDLNL